MKNYSLNCLNRTSFSRASTGLAFPSFALMRLRTYIIDAFVVGGQSGTGNAAGVVLLPSVTRYSQLNRPPASTMTSNDADDDETGAAPPFSLDDAARQRLAAELRQTETAFVERCGPKGGSSSTFLLRWFTPTTEVPLCGHATLAAAAALVAEGVKGSDEEGGGGGGGGGGEATTATYCFETVSSGLLRVRVRFPAPSSAPPPSSASAPAPTFELDLPSRAPTDPPPRGLRRPRALAAEDEGSPSGPTSATLALLRALERRRDGGGDGGGDAGDEPPPPLLLRRLRGISFNAELGYLVVALEPGGDIVSSEEMIGGLDPDPRALREAVLLAEEGVSSSGEGSSGRGGSGGSVSGVIVTSLAATDGRTIVSRFFAPWMGIDEDPVTGSAHAVVAPLWAGDLLRRGHGSREGPRSGGGGVTSSAAVGSAAPPFWRARQLSARGGELSVCFLQSKQRVLVVGGAAVALEGWAHV